MNMEQMKEALRALFYCATIVACVFATAQLMDYAEHVSSVPQQRIEIIAIDSTQGYANASVYLDRFPPLT